MLLFEEIRKNLEQLVESENNNNTGKVIKLKIKLKDNEYFIYAEARYKNILERYLLESKKDYCKLASFFEAIMNWERHEYPIEIFDENNIRFSEKHNSEVNEDSLKETLKKTTISLLIDLSVKMLDPQLPCEAKDEFIKSLALLNKNNKTLISLFRETFSSL
jgi:hypothetical protein